VNRSARTILVSLSLLLSGLGTARCEGNAPDAGRHVFYLGEERVVVLRFNVLIDGEPYAAAWEEYLQRRFKELDANGDGALEGDEQRGIPNAQLLTQLGLVTRTDQSSNIMLDINPKDGKVSREEFVVWLKRMELEPFRVRIDQQPNANMVRTAPVARQAADEAPRVLFQKLDADGDGQITADDFRNAPQALRKLDLDRDESISSNELVQTANFFLAAVGGTDANQPASPQFLSPSAGQPLRQLAQQLLAARDGHGGAAKDNRLSFAELGLPAEKLQPFDADGDGALDFEETQQFLHDPPADVDLIVRLGKRDKDQKALEFVGQSAGRTSDDLASLTLGKVQMEFSSQGEIYVRADAYARMFKSMDQDNNGYLETMEVQRFGLNAQLFALLDTDKDGKLFEKEYLDVMTPLGETERFRVQLDVAQRGRDLFRILDTSGDGRLGPREFQAAVGRMSHWDANGDGRLAEAEIPQQFRLVVGRGTLNPTGRVAVTTTAMRASPGVRTQQAGGPTWFVRMDRNGDGDVSQLEFLGPAEVFGRLDADSNGLLDASEAASKD
jgi:Ca2+-binding EF-hand superfamily protein